MEFENRLDMAFRPGLMVNRMYSIVKTQDSLYFFHTGPGLNLNIRGRGIEKIGANYVINKGLKKIKLNEEKIAGLSSDELLILSKHSFSTKIQDISNFEYIEKGGLWNGYVPVLKLTCLNKNFKFRFQYLEEKDVSTFMKQIKIM
jgi:hypothetical protein